MIGFARAELFQGIERRSGGQFEGLGELLYGCERLAELLTEPRCALVERFQHLLFAFGFDLLAGQSVAGLRVDSTERDHVMRAKVCDGTDQHGFDAYALTDFAAHVAGDALFGGLAHILQRILDSRLRKNIQIRRLLELYRQRLLESAIKDRIASGVHKLGEKNRILFSKSAGAPGKHESNRYRNDHKTSDSHPKPVLRTSRRGNSG